MEPRPEKSMGCYPHAYPDGLTVLGSRQCELADPSAVGDLRRFTTAATADRFMGKNRGSDEAWPATTRLSALAARREHPEACNVCRGEHGENTP